MLIRGNTIMKGYLKNPQATAQAFRGGWFHTGDVAVVHSDGYIQITDRSKDVIISGGENISSVEVEDVLHRHPRVLHAAVVAQPDEKWGESALRVHRAEAGGPATTAAELIAFCREPSRALQVSAQRCLYGFASQDGTGKIQKFKLREAAGSREAITRLARPRVISNHGR
jgi:fatty-acyl-CoA synthase